MVLKLLIGNTGQHKASDSELPQNAVLSLSVQLYNSSPFYFHSLTWIISPAEEK